jgi:predicted membrane protein
MEEKKPVSAITAGLIIAGVSIVYSLISNVIAGTGGAVGFFEYIVIIAALVVFINLYAKTHDNNLTFGDLFSYGFKATAIYTLIFLVFISILLISTPELKQKALEEARKELESRKMPDSDIEKSIDIVGRYFWIAMVGSTMFFLVLVGAIGSAIGAAIAKKRPQNPFEQPKE